VSGAGTSLYLCYGYVSALLDWLEDTLGGKDPMPMTTKSVSEASRHLYEALTHHAGNRDFDAHDPLVLAISAFGEKCRQHDEEAIKAASRHLYEELTRHFGPRDFDAHDPLVHAISEYGDACRAEGPRPAK